MTEAIIIFACYILGAIPFSYLTVKLFSGSDIREKGSGNVGATNVLRIMGWKVAAAALAGDLLKGFFAAMLAYYCSIHFQVQLDPRFMSAFGGLFAVLGHCWPVFLQFRGGKGVATAAGALLFIMPVTVLILAAIFAAVIAISRYVSLGSVTAAFLLPLAVWITTDYPPYYKICMAITLIVVFKHRNNLAKLMSGTERKLGEKA